MYCKVATEFCEEIVCCYDCKQCDCDGRCTLDVETCKHKTDNEQEVKNILKNSKNSLDKTE